MKNHDILTIASQFQLPGSLAQAEPFGNGHINDTFCVTCQTDQGPVRTVLQRINQNVFKTPVQVMENLQRVTEHIQAKLAADSSPMASRQLMTVKTRDNQTYYRNAQDDVWRMVSCIEQAVTLEIIETPDLAFETARMFGWFQRMLTDLPGPALHETIPDFHNTPKRFQAFQAILKQDPCHRAKDAQPEIDFVLKHASVCDVLLDHVSQGRMPVRVTHNDTKINNVMLDQDTHEGVCVIDLDTVMPGLSLYDFGDMVRTATSPTEEDEQDLSLVTMRMPIFDQLVRGFAQETHAFLTPVEKKHLAFSGKLITLEQMIRFLGDHLAGDTYYKIHRENHNLDRCRTQMALVESIMAQEESMNALADSVFEALQQ
ncbi:MAG: aminoglycoside phosphotransferase family protein [Planctomycetes bacterium]|nr:aminoglycoside phosphotransferase family protein [Planctomycetota bacterium]